MGEFVDWRASHLRVTRSGVAIYRGSRPPSHSYLQKAGITHRIDLQYGFHEVFREDQLEKEDPLSFGIRFLDYDLSDFTPPSYEAVKDLITTIAKIPTGKRVFIHCLHGKDRTGFICACIEVACGKTITEAIKTMFEYGFHKVPYLLWLPSLYRTLRRLEKEGVTL